MTPEEAAEEELREARQRCLATQDLFASLEESLDGLVQDFPADQAGLRRVRRFVQLASYSFERWTWHASLKGEERGVQEVPKP